MLCPWPAIGKYLAIDSWRPSVFRSLTSDIMLLFVGYSRCIYAKKGMACGLVVWLFVWVGILESGVSKTIVYAPTKTNA
jgi:hypothetical protein